MAKCLRTSSFDSMVYQWLKSCKQRPSRHRWHDILDLFWPKIPTRLSDHQWRHVEKNRSQGELQRPVGGFRAQCQDVERLRAVSVKILSEEAKTEDEEVRQVLTIL